MQFLAVDNHVPYTANKAGAVSLGQLVGHAELLHPPCKKERRAGGVRGQRARRRAPAPCPASSAHLGTRLKKVARNIIFCIIIIIIIVFIIIIIIIIIILIG